MCCAMFTVFRGVFILSRCSIYSVVIIHVVSIAAISAGISGKIKELLSVELDIPVSKMELHGWRHKNDALIQDTVSFCAAVVFFMDA